MTRITTALGTALLAGAAQAHEGHGMPGAQHWHATDVGLMLLAALAAGAWWWIRRK